MEKPEFLIYLSSTHVACVQVLCHGRTGGCGGEEYNQWLASTLAAQSGNCTALGSSGAKKLWVWKY